MTHSFDCKRFFVPASGRFPTRKALYRIPIAAGMLLLICTVAGAQSRNGWKPLGDTYSTEALGKLLIPREDWKPYPNDRHPEGFAGVPREAQQKLIHEAETFLHASWGELPATTFLEFARNGNRTDYETLSFRRRHQLAVLVLAEVFERKGRFIDQIINGIWAISEESFWGVPAHMFLQHAGNGLPDIQEPVIDLFTAETAQELAWTSYLLGEELDKVSPLVTARIAAEEKRRVLDPYLSHDNWDYLGFNWKKDPRDSRRVNNWNPWINSNVLVTALLSARDPDLRARVVHKTMESLDNFMIPYPADGGSDEGPEYWGRAAGAALDYLETLKSATGGKIDVMGLPLLQKMGAYSYETYIAGPYYFNYGDADAIYHPDPALLYRFGRDTRDSVLMRFAAFQARQRDYFDHPVTEPFGMLNRALAALFSLQELKAVAPAEPLAANVWLEDLQIMAARSQAGSRKGFYLAVKGGTNGESHNHNDVGNFIVYFDGRPVLIDAGAQTYTAQTFGPRRYELWNNQSSYHNLPDINGCAEKEGAAFRAARVTHDASARVSSLSLDIAGAYPQKAAVRSWTRKVSLVRPGTVTLKEDYRLEKYVAPVVENFLTPRVPDLSAKGVVRFPGPASAATVELHYDARAFSAAVDTIAITDGNPVDENAPQGSRTGRMYGNWGPRVYRVRLTATGTALAGSYTFTLKEK